MLNFFRTTFLVITLLSLAGLAGFAQTAPAGGVVISNQAHASYSDPSGNQYEVDSTPVTVTVMAVGGVLVTPDDQTPSTIIVANDKVNKLFRACNIGNAPDTYTVIKSTIPSPSTLDALYWDIDNSGTLTAGDLPITLNSTDSPVLQPGQCIGIVATISTGAVTVDSLVPISITAQGKVPGKSLTDDGTIIAKVGASPKATDPGNPSLPPLKLVENKDQITSTPGSTLTYSLSFRNRGAVPATNALLTDDLPAELDYVPGSLKLGTKVLTDESDSDEGLLTNNGRRIEIRLAKVDPDQTVIAYFQAKLNSNVIPGLAVINTATVAADNIGPATRTSRTKVVINPFGTVYDGYSDGSLIVAGAQVVLTNDQGGQSPVVLSGNGFDPNSSNGNPFITDSKGHFSFAIPPGMIGAPGSPVTYFLQVTAPGYRPRTIEVRLEPTSGELFKVDIRATDGQPISKAGSFALSNGPITLQDVAALVLNIPVFESASLQVAKYVDRQRAEIGDILTYRLDLTNPTALTISGIQVTDTPAQSLSYVAGTARLQIDGTNPIAIEPSIAANQLLFKVGDLAPGAHASISYRVRVGANARQGEQTNIAIASGHFPNGQPVTTSPSKAVVYIGMGVFSMRQVIIGRVFEDTNGNGLFEKGDRAVAGVRVYLSNGMSVITDANGMYNFPSVESGAAVVSLDPVTVPRGYGLIDDRTRSGRSWTRLVRTPLDGGGLSRVNFALEKIANPITDAMTDIGDGGGLAKDSSGGAGSGGAVSARTSSRSSDKGDSTENSGDVRKEGDSPATTGGALDGFIDRIRGPRTRAGVKAVNVGRNGNRAAGTYTEASTETIEPVAPGAIKVLSPDPGEVIMDAGLRVEARVHLDYSVRLELNGERVPDTNVAVKEVDRKNKVRTYAYVGISLRPGPNSLRATALGPEGEIGQSVDLKVMGRGPAVKLQVIADRKDIQSGGRDSTLLKVKAEDAWGNPAAGGQVALQVSAGRLLRREAAGIAQPTKQTESAATVDPSVKDCSKAGVEKPGPACIDQPRTKVQAAVAQKPADRTTAPLIGSGIEPTNGISAEQVNAMNRQQILTLEAGEAEIELIGEGQPGIAEIRALSGDLNAQTSVRIIPEIRPQILVGVAELTVGKSSPDIVNSGDDRNYRQHSAFYFRGPLPASTQLTLAYNSSSPLNRTAGQDRRFFLDPLDRVYPLLGDTSTRFEDAQSNSKLYTRVDRGRSYAMFGDFDASQQEYARDPVSNNIIGNLAENLASSGIGNGVLGNLAAVPVFASQGPQLTGYNRKLTGVKVHLENSEGSSITMTGARPDTAFARDLYPGSTLGLVQLSHSDILQGSETIVREVRDRRNPDLILQRETLVRSVDYNLDNNSGAIFFLRPMSTFDYSLNLVQIVATYEYFAVGMNSAVYTARGSKNFNSLRLRVGASFVDQRQDSFGSFYLGGIDAEKKIGKNGQLQFEWGMSEGRVASSGTFFGFDGLNGSVGSGNGEHNGQAFRAEYVQGLGFNEARIQASFSRADQSFFNPFGATISPGSQRGSVALDFKPLKSAQIRLGFSDETNKTSTFDNHRVTGSIGWIQQFNDKLRFSAGYDYRNFSDTAGSALAASAGANGTTGATATQFAGHEVTSNLITVGAEYRPTDKASVAIKREQNLGASDPTYPNQTTIAASYRLNSLAKLFFTERLASQAISAISDTSAAGFAATASRHETAIGIESSLSKFSTLSGRYQIDNGINGTDSFAVIGLVNKFPLTKVLSLDAGYERGVHLKGNGDSFNNLMFGFSYSPTDAFRSAVRYELRDMYGFGSIFTAGAAGRIRPGLTTLARLQISKTAFQNQASNSMMNGQLALAWRPQESDKTAFLFSYTHRALDQGGRSGFQPTIQRDDIVSGDGLYQPFRRLEIYGRFALKFNSSGSNGVPLASALTMLGQARGEYRLARYFDVAGEVRSLWAVGTGSRRDSLGAEAGFWVLSDLRVAGGYNFSRFRENPGYFGGFGLQNNLNTRRGFYFVLTSKLSNMFNLFGTSNEGLPGHEPTLQPSTGPRTASDAPPKK